ncbi:hypothetical protein [Alsobacter sp. R-9]
MIRIISGSSTGRIGTATIPGWAVGLAGAAAVAIGLVILVLGLGIALVLAPIAIGGALIARWRLKRAFDEAAADLERREAPAGVIDADYRVIDDRRP